VGGCQPIAGENASAGTGYAADEAEKNQRERLFAAMVARVAEQGYDATTVGDLVELSGVSRSAFYRHFSDKQACFIAAIESLVEPALATVSAGMESTDGPLMWRWQSRRSNRC